MTIAIISLAAALVVLLILAAVQRLHARPSDVAARRLKAQLDQLQRELASLRHVDHASVAQQEELVRQQWIVEQMAGTPIETIDIPGISDATFETLREHGVVCLRDLAKFGQRGFKVPNIGAKKASQLLAAHRDASRRFVEQARRMDRAALDEASSGKLSAALQRHEAAELERQRDDEWTRIRIRDVERRRLSQSRSLRGPRS